jgi:hypothetical protein
LICFMIMLTVALIAKPMSTPFAMP